MMERSPARLFSSPKRRRITADAFPAMKRTSSNNSSTSSDILVAAGPPHTPSQQQANQQQSGDYLISQVPKQSPVKRTEASVANGRLTIWFGPRVARDRLRGIVRTKPKPVSRASNTSAFPESKTDDDEYGEGPNHRGTYSKEYVLKHPEINWIHRGQGRYLPASETKSESSTVYPRPTKQTTERTSDSVAMSEQTMERMTQALWQHFDGHRRKNNPQARENWSPSFKHHFNLILDLIKQTPRQRWPTAIENIRGIEYREVVRKWNKAMDRQYPMNAAAGDWEQNEESIARATRLSRQAKTAIPSIEHRRSARQIDAPNNYDEDDEAAELSDDSQDPEKTFRKDYVDAHPNEEFHHTGNGWWKRGPRASESDVNSNSSASHAMKSSSSAASHDVDTIHKSDLWKYPLHTFHHKGNGWYRHGESPNGMRASISISADGQVITHASRRSEAKGIAQGEDEERTVAKAKKRNAAEKIGTAHFVRKSSGFDNLIGTATPTASSDRRSSRAENSFNKSYPESHASDDISRSSVLSKRVSRPSVDTELFNKAYVEAHPNEGPFHHRGQGRYARGKKPEPASSQDVDETTDTEGLVDGAFVDAHPNETFYHRGQGRWARGLPPPGTSNKTAVRGPGAKDKTAATRPEEENEAGEKAPPPSTLLKREEGPDKWPKLNWHYRGGGKWCRLTKEEIEKAAAAAYNRPRTSTGRGSRGDGPGAQLQREHLAAETALSGGRKAPGGLLAKSKMIRKRSQQSAVNAASKASSNSQSKAPTPRPALLPPEEDRLTEEDLPSLYKDAWSSAEEDELDEAERILRREYDPIVGAQPYVAALTKFDPAVRSLGNLKQIALNAQTALMQLQDEYLKLDITVAQHPMPGKKERKPVKGGRQTVDHAVWEDKKEATLYDYNFDPRKIGYQDPQAQKIIRDEEGRELRRRRNRNAVEPGGTAINYGDGEMTSRRTVKPVSRFDGVVVPPPRKRSRLTAVTAEEDANLDADPNIPPDRSATPSNNFEGDWDNPKRGRWTGHIPKWAQAAQAQHATHARVQQLRGDSVGSGPSDRDSPRPSSGAGVRKGRPPGSKNLHKRKDAGIKKGPRKPKTASSETPPGGSVEPDGPMSIPAIIENPPVDMPAAAAPDQPMRIREAVGQAFSPAESGAAT